MIEFKGSMLNNEEDLIDCARCKCSHNLLQCTAYRCDMDVNFMFIDRNDGNNTNSARPISTTNIKDSSLPDLVSLMHTIETLAYKYYVDALSRNHSYHLIYKDISDDKQNQNSNKDIEESSELVGIEEKSKVIVFKSNPNRLLGLYFVPPKLPPTTASSSASSSIYFNSNYFILIFFMIFFRIFY